VNDRDFYIEAWRAATSEKERAECEMALWELVADEIDHGRIKRRGNMGPLLGCLGKPIEDRATIAFAPIDVGALIWEELDRGNVTLAGAQRALTLARGVWRHEGGELIQHVRRAIKMGRGKRGKMHRAGKKVPPTVWKRVEAVIDRYLASELEGLDQPSRDALLSRFRVDLHLLFTDWAEVIRARKRHSAGLGEIVRMSTRNEVLAACRALDIAPPPPGAPADLAAAKKQRKKLARLYHPDVQGTDAARDKFAQVMAAYLTLEAYNEGKNDAPNHQPPNGAIHGE